jgi:hypothetical protein
MVRLFFFAWDRWAAAAWRCSRRTSMTGPQRMQMVPAAAAAPRPAAAAQQAPFLINLCDRLSGVSADAASADYPLLQHFSNKNTIILAAESYLLAMH